MHIKKDKQAGKHRQALAEIVSDLLIEAYRDIYGIEVTKKS